MRHIRVIFSIIALMGGSLFAASGALAACKNCGTVQSVVHHQAPGTTSGGGAILGGIAGGVIGHQIGSGRGNTAATVLGAAGGAYAGNEIERRHEAAKSTGWQVRVRMDNGTLRYMTYRDPPPFRKGERVEFVEGRLVAMR
jgi:outer membrane lipoprotein SlyB